MAPFRRFSGVFATTAMLATLGFGCTPSTPAPAPAPDASAALAACQSFENGSTQSVADTTRVFVNLPSALYPKDITSDFSTVSGNATAGYVSNAGLPGMAEGAPDGCWSTYIEFDGNGEVDLSVKALDSGTNDYQVKFIVGSPEASTWKTYASSTCGFAFEYPADWVTTESAAGISLTSPETTKAMADFETNHILGEAGPSYDFSAGCWGTVGDFAKDNGYADLSGSTLAALLIAAQDNAHDTTKLGETTIDGRSASEVLIGGVGATYQLWVGNETVTVLSFPGASKRSELTENQAHILSTFVFTK